MRSFVSSRWRAVLSPLFLAWLLTVPASGEPAGVSSQPLAPRSKGGPALFTNLPATETGVDMQNPLIPDHPMSFLYPTGWACGGVAIGDLNGDGVSDIFFTSGPAKNTLYLQRPGERFHFDKSPIDFDPHDNWSGGAVLVDINGDGKLDIYVSNYDASNELWLNETTSPDHPSFREAAKDYGLDFKGANLMSEFMDYDHDGNLDVYLVNNRFVPPHGFPETMPAKMVNGKVVVDSEWQRYFQPRQDGPTSFKLDQYGQRDRLFRNDGKRFADVSDEVGITDNGFGLSATWLDYDGDGWMDLYVANDFEDPDRLYHNLGPDAEGKVHFKNVIGDVMPYTSWSSMGSDIGDLQNEGALDLVVADMSATTHYKGKVNMGEMAGYRRQVLETGWPRQAMRNMMFLNDRMGQFREGAFLAGMAKTDWTWAVKLADFDNDGRTDVFFTNGVSRNYTDSDRPYDPTKTRGISEWEFYKDQPPMPEKHLAFKNLGDVRFEDVSKAWGLDAEGMTYSAATGDLDGDGDLDLVMANLDGTVSVYRNDSQTGNRAVFHLKGAKANTYGIGAVVTIKSRASGTQAREMNPMTGFISSNEPLLHFGLGIDEKIDEVRVRWGDGKQQILRDLAANQSYTITETPDAAPAASPPPQPMFAEVSSKIGLDFTHHENDFDDYKREPLLPAKLSRFGPGLAWGDANGDGFDDLFIGGAKGQPGALYLVDAEGQLHLQKEGPWNADADCEDMGVVWIDANSDGKLDLLAASGGNEELEGSPLLRTRLYLNNGIDEAGNVLFVPAPEGAIPPQMTSSSVVSAADFNGDGKVDLFSGSRSVPGKYPETPRSRLLRNDSANGEVKFTDVTDELAPGLASAGLVTSAVWTDIDGDGRPDLVVSCEWGPVRLFMNTGGKLQEQTKEAGLADRLGWWNGVTAGDLNGDGKMDLVVTNAGLNTKYGTATPEKPEFLYYGDMDGSGRKQLVEAKPGTQGALPVRGRSCSSSAMPFIKQKFANYRAFAGANLTEIYGSETLDKALRLEANCLESGVLINETNPGQPPHFAWHPLPRMAQIAPGYGVAVADFDGDGNNDIYLVQNLYSREPETGLWRGGVSQLLRGKGNGEFECSPPADSGLVVSGDAKGLALADLRHEGHVDVFVTQNDSRALAFASSEKGSRTTLAIRLAGRAGNPAAIGARITAVRKSGRKQLSELAAGSGYLSQSAPVAFLGSDSKDPLERIEVRWPDGTVSSVTRDLKGPFLQVTQPPAATASSHR